MPPNTQAPVVKPQIKSIRPFAVSVVITETRSYVVDARTPEEAEAIVEDWIEDGEAGTVSDTEIIEIEAYPVEDDSTNAPLNRTNFPCSLDPIDLENS